MENKKFGIYIGRFSPLHKGHEAVIDQMIIDFGYGNCLVLIGSPNAELSQRNIFPYLVRRQFVKRVYPYLNTLPLTDFDDNFSWMTSIEDIISLLGYVKEDVVFYGGCQEDVALLKEYAYDTKILDRTTGVTPIISATEIKQKLSEFKFKGVDEWVNDKIANLIAWHYAKGVTKLNKQENDKRSIQG